MGNLFRAFLKLLGFLTLAGGLVLALLLLTAGWWLPLDEEPHPADYIVSLAGSQARALHAADLYTQGLAPKVLVSTLHRNRVRQELDALGVPAPHDEEVAQSILRIKGVPEADVATFGFGSISTVQEALELERLCAAAGAEHGRMRLLVVTSPFHVRRTTYIFADNLKSCSFQVVGSPYEPFAKEWWHDRDSAQALVMESAKFLFYFLGGRYLAPKPAPQTPQTASEAS